jgi:hypothetical protein
MRAKRTILIVFVNLAAVTWTMSCKTVHVQRCSWDEHAPAGKGEHKLQGIPFYAKAVSYVQTTAYEVRWLKVDLRVKVKDGNAWTESETYTRMTEAEENTSLESLRQAVFDANMTRARGDDAAVAFKEARARIMEAKRKVYEAFQNLAAAPCALMPPDSNCVSNHCCKPPDQPVSNLVSRSAIVDYDHPLCLNARAPLFGKAELTQKLAPDGTLTDVSSSADMSETASQVASLLPLKEVLMAETSAAKAVLPFAEGTPGGELPAYRYELVVEEVGYTYEFQKEHKAMPESPIPIPFSVKSGVFTRRPISSVPAAPKVTGDEASIASKIVLPKKN